MIGGAEGDRTPDLMTASAITSTASDYGSYDLLTFVTGCSRQRVHLLPPINTDICVVLSQVCLSHMNSRPGCQVESPLEFAYYANDVIESRNLTEEHLF